MEFNEGEEPIEEQQDYDVEIYSKSAIWGFSIFFSTIFGGVLLMLNLRAAGFKKEAYTVLAFSIAYLLLTSVIMNVTGASGILALAFNAIGAGILTQYFFNKYFPEEDYYPKSIVVPLLISFLICIPIAIFVYYNAPHTAVK